MFTWNFGGHQQQEKQKSLEKMNRRGVPGIFLGIKTSLISRVNSFLFGSLKNVFILMATLFTTALYSWGQRWRGNFESLAEPLFL